jgi:PKD repeat protein
VQLGLSSTTSTVAPALAVASNGDAAAVWTEGTGVITARRSGPTGAWSSSSQIGTGATPAVIFDSSADLAAAFEDSSGVVSSLLAVAGSGLVPPSISVTAAGWKAPALAADGNQDLFGVWPSSAGTGIQSVVYDAEPPSTPAITAPATALVGQSVAFSAAATDRWSNVAYTWDFGDGASGSGATPSHAYAAPGTYTARVTAVDGGGNQSIQTQTVTVTAAQAPGLPRPIAGQTVNLEPVSGTVLVKVPGSNTFVLLTAPEQVRDGSIIDARKGRVRITIDNGRGGLDTAEFYGGVFRFTQPKVKPGQTRFANLYLFGGSFKRCPRAPRNPKVASLSKTKSKKQAQGKSVRHLWGSGEGAFRTVGRFSSATVRGTTWLTDDRCNGTLTKVTAGKVGVRDFVKRKTIVVKAPKRYLARARKTR